MSVTHYHCSPVLFMNSHFCPPAIQSGSQQPIMGYYKCCQVLGLVCPTSVNRCVHWLCRDIPLSISFQSEKLFISPCSSGALTAMPAAACLFKLGLTQHCTRSRVWIFGTHASGASAGSHLYFCNHVVVRLHVDSEGLPHFPLAIIQDLDLYGVLLVARFELNI